jgi:protein gp37
VIRAFPNSTSDFFHESLTDGDITLLFAVMIMAQDWDFQVLTKRSDRMREYLSKPRWHIWSLAGRMIDPARWQNLRPIIGGDHTPPPNIWLGVSVEDQATKYRIEHLRATPAAKRFVSAEPLLEHLGDVNLTGIDQVIVGGESGPGARDNNFLTNARSLLTKCRAAGVAFYGKQNVGKGPLPADLQVREFPA